MSNKMDNQIGLFIAKLRKEHNLTQQDLANKLIMSRENISKIERGVNRPSIDTLAQLSNIFDISINELIAGCRKNLFNEKEINGKNLNYNHNREKKYQLICKSLLCLVLLLVLSLILILNRKHLYKFKINNKDGYLMISQNNCYFQINNLDINSHYSLIYKIYYKKYKFTYLNLTNEEIIDKEKILLNNISNHELMKFKCNLLEQDMIKNNLYLKINDTHSIKVEYK